MITTKCVIKAINFAIGKPTLSAAQLQIKFYKGYNWADSMMKILEEKKIVSPFREAGINCRKIIASDSVIEKIINDMGASIPGAENTSVKT
ncbi:MAG: hypothetical protein Q7W13_13190 [Bacteroidia bacterium]|nr:hypothetical protein [Bacteroidia bacterium]